MVKALALSNKTEKQSIIAVWKLNGKQFIDFLSGGIQAVPNGLSMKERFFVLCATILQKDKTMKSSPDIRCLVRTWMSMRENAVFWRLFELKNQKRPAFEVTVTKK